MTGRGGTTVRDNHRRAVRRRRDPCGICHHPIDYGLRWPDAWCFVADHIIPIARGGPDTLDNLQAAHRHCNQVKYDKLLAEMAAVAGPREYVTSRTW